MTKQRRREAVEEVGKHLQDALDKWAESGEGADAIAMMLTTSLLPDEILLAMLRRVSFGVPDAEALATFRQIVNKTQLSWLPPPGFTAADWALVRRSTVQELMGPDPDHTGNQER